MKNLRSKTDKDLSLYWDRLFATIRIIKGECTIFAACRLFQTFCRLLSQTCIRSIILLIRKQQKQIASFRKERHMRHKSIELMGTIKAFVEEYYMNYRHSPSTTQIADAVGIARGTAYKYLIAMNENGMIRYDGQQISTEQTEKV